ncbi:hypothetical protein [Rhizobium sp. FKY42]|uniref:YunG family protein n=1 Tax=Rhizobium sp. FKY42 TaxID=2562310 RepID=UPI00197FE9F1|nr:hypothetical protein [Rhizobium sp. FKY42]
MVASIFRDGTERTSVDDLAAALVQAWSRETSSLWSPENPARGQCGVTALLAQELLGGAIVKTHTAVGPHFYNCIDGQRVDLTASQFDQLPTYQDLPSSREEAESDCTAEQLSALRRAFCLS